MFRPMRRHTQQLTHQEAVAMLEQAKSGVLALSGDDDYPYALPISHVYADGKLYFHCAKTGHKIDAILRNEKASFCVIDQDKIVPERYTTYFRSAIAFGRIRILEDFSEAYAALQHLAKKYHPTDSAEGRHKAIDDEKNAVCVLEMTIEHLTGKEAIELVKAKQQ